MKKIYSRVQEDVLLHIVNRSITKDRVDLSPKHEYLQVACFEMGKGKTFRPHKHIENNRQTQITQESWVVVRGKVKAVLYDLDDKVIATEILEQGECVITFRGGHTYECIDDDTAVYEFKTGPYEGQEKDKVFI